MATGDAADVKGRIASVLPPWFADLHPVLDSLITGLATALSYVFSLLAYVKLQTRIRTATEGSLDLIANDFFGSTVKRTSGQGDAAFRSLILSNLFRERGTRKSVINILTQLTGRTPIIFEPQRPLDTGVYGGPYSGYGAAGGYGSMALPFQAFVTAFRPAGVGIQSVTGYGGPSGGYGGGIIEYAPAASISGGVSDSDIYAAIDSVKPVGTILWTKILNWTEPQLLYVDGTPFTINGAQVLVY